jgi:hypothetical protein
VEQDRSRRFVPGPHEREQSVQLPQEDHTEHTPAPNRVNTAKNLAPLNFASRHTDKKENNLFLIYKEIQSGAVAKSYRGKAS